MSNAMLKVGVTAGGGTAWADGSPSYAPYADAVTSAGLVPVRLAPDGAWRDGAALDGLSGLLLTGGPDVEPALYLPELARDAHAREAFIAEHSVVLAGARDEAEIILLRRAIALGMPVLAICRGIQVLNVALGGKLIADLRTPVRHRAFADLVGEPSARHEVHVARGTALAEAIGEGKASVNSRHHQGFTEAELAPGLQMAAVAPDGVVEAVVMEGAAWVMGVQWHPERRADADVFRRDARIFRAFAEAARPTRR